jgi:hypothetical protein
VLEAGDCEELWFVRSTADYPKLPSDPTTLDVAAKLKEIVDSHHDIYDTLVRTARTPRSATWCACAWRTKSATDIANGVPPPVPFVIYDGCIIDGVKTMMEKTAFDLLKDVATLVAGQVSGNAQGAAHDREMLGRSPHAAL